MRRASNGTAIITSPIAEGPNGPSGGQVIGVNLGWSFVAEHEWGIKGIVSAFGVPGEPRRGLVGADVRTVTEVPKGLKLFEFDDAVYLMYSRDLDPEWMKHFSRERELTANDLNRSMEVHRNDDEISAAWSESDFGIRLKKTAADKVIPVGTMVLGQLYEALQQKDAMIFLGGHARSLGNSGLVIVIRSRMPEDFLRQMRDCDEEYLNLADAVAKVESETKLKDKLETAGKGFYALSPRWANDDEKKETNYPVVYWLNPQDQQNNNYGWYTAEQLLEWAEGKGPIPKPKAS